MKPGGVVAVQVTVPRACGTGVGKRVRGEFVRAALMRVSVYDVSPPEVWPDAVWSVMRERGGTSWNLQAPEPEWCLCWPAQVVDLRESGLAGHFCFLDDEDTPPLHSEVMTLTGGWLADTPRRLAVEMSKHLPQLLRPHRG